MSLSSKIVANRSQQMRAVVANKSGSAEVLKLERVSKPNIKNHEVLIRVYASSVTAGDLILRKLHPLLFIPLRFMGIKRKRIPGHEFSGEVVEVGAEVKRFKPGELVFGTTTGLSVGAYAEYLALPEIWKRGVISLKPTNMSHKEAAVLPVGAMTALQILKRGQIESGHKVLIYGASGSVGSFAVQFARYFGAEVTAVCSDANKEWVKSLGAHRIIDYTKEDFSKQAQKYDLIFDAVGKIGLNKVHASLTEKGQFLSVKTTTKEDPGLLAFIKKLVEEDHIKPVLDRCYTLDSIVSAHTYVETGRKKGNVAIVVGGN
ncbi:MAG: NAD(P)-dependent alcohol dehydrogenase [Trueperaceae bacterium]|nr:NAD(P)-dependent alcohol dehydrogenase [Trueperaceae bacterium]